MLLMSPPVCHLVTCRLLLAAAAAWCWPGLVANVGGGKKYDLASHVRDDNVQVPGDLNEQPSVLVHDSVWIHDMPPPV